MNDYFNLNKPQPEQEEDVYPSPTFPSHFSKFCNMLVSFSEIQNFIGHSNPMKKIYVTGDNIDLLPFILYFMIHFQIGHLYYDANVDQLV